MIQYRMQDLVRGLQEFPNGCFDMVYADPPYFKAMITTKTLKGDIGLGTGYWKWTEDWLREAVRTARWSAHIYISFTIANIWELMQVVKNLNRESSDSIRFNGMIVWDYTSGAMGGGRLKGGLRLFTPHSYWYNYEPVVYLSKGKAKPLNFFRNPDFKNSVWHIRPPHKKIHPTQKPEELFRRMLAFSSKQEDLVLDCFSGSGELLLVSEKMNRSAVGFDLDQRWKSAFEKRLLTDGMQPIISEIPPKAPTGRLKYMRFPQKMRR